MHTARQASRRRHRACCPRCAQRACCALTVLAPPSFVVELIATRLRLLSTKPADLLQLPTMPHGRLRLAVRLANAGAKAAFQLRPELCVAVCTKIVRLCLTHGNTPECAIGYMV